MFRRIFNYLQRIQPIPLGRWCLKDKSKNNWKVDTANTDHCGTCSYYTPKPSNPVNQPPVVSPSKLDEKLIK